MVAPVHPYDKADLEGSVIREIRRVSESLGKTPTVKEYKRARPRHGYDQVVYLFGTWNAAVARAGLQPNPTQQPPRNDIPRPKLVEEMVRVANLLGEIPSHSKFSANSKFSRGAVEREFGSWRAAWGHIVMDHRQRLTFEPRLRNVRAADKGREPRPLRISVPLVHEPRNEQETFALFCLLAADLGFEILKAQTDFPDLELRRDGQPVFAELEFLSSNYLEHGHPLSAEYACICWRKDCALDPVQVIDLERHVRDRAGHATS
jgi:hypothetical protein